jgi:rRNA maturation endonuclease Nob1
MPKLQVWRRVCQECFKRIETKPPPHPEDRCNQQQINWENHPCPRCGSEAFDWGSWVTKDVTYVNDQTAD